MWQSWGWSTSAATSMWPASERRSPGHGPGGSAVTTLAALRDHDGSSGPALAATAGLGAAVVCVAGGLVKGSVNARAYDAGWPVCRASRL